MHKVKGRPVTNKTMVQYKNAIARAQLGENLAYHMAYIFAYVLYAKMDLSFKQVSNYYDKVIDLRKKWQDDDNEEITSDWLIGYANKKKIDVVGFVKSIPLSHKLYLADMRKRGAIGGYDNIESAFVSCLCLSFPSLKETYRFSNDKIGEFLDCVADCIDSYYRKQPHCKDHYLSDTAIREMFIEECGWDIHEGKKVE